MLSLVRDSVSVPTVNSFPSQFPNLSKPCFSSRSYNLVFSSDIYLCASLPRRRLREAQRGKDPLGATVRVMVCGVFSSLSLGSHNSFNTDVFIPWSPDFKKTLYVWVWGLGVWGVRGL